MCVSALFALGREKEAEKYLAKVPEEKRSFAKMQGLCALAAAQIRSGKKEEAKETMERYFEFPQEEERYEPASFQFVLQQLELTDEWIKRTDRPNFQGKPQYETIAFILMKQKRYEEAEEMFFKAMNEVEKINVPNGDNQRMALQRLLNYYFQSLRPPILPAHFLQN